MELLKENSIGKLVATNYRAASIFKKYGIDFCCQGNKTIEEACQKKNVSTETLLSDLKEVLEAKSKETIDFNSWPLDLLIDYITKKHHSYVETKILEIKPYLHKLCKVHGQRHPELFEITDQFNASADELTVHMKKEELILFPYVKKLVKASEEKTTLENPHFGTVQNPIAMMMSEHEIEGERFRKIAQLSNDYTPPEDACNTYRVTYAMLKEFEEDLHLHIHLENNILFPKALKLENNL